MDCLPDLKPVIRSAPEAPVSRPEGGPGPITREACYARHTGPQGAKFGDSSRPCGPTNRMMAANPQDYERMAGS
jgi:hypothetical protein